MALTRGWKVLLATSVGVYLVSLDVTVVNIAFPALSRDFAGTSRNALAWVLSGYNIAFAAALLTSGRLADRFGRKRVFTIGVVSFSLASMACGLAPTAAFLILFRVIQALGGALIVPASLALVLPEFPANRRSAAIGVWGAVGALAAATGPSLGSVVVENIGWRAVFFLNAPLLVITLLYSRRLLVEWREPGATGIPDILGAAMGSAAVGFLVLAIAQGDQWGYTSGRTALAVMAAAVLLPAFLVRCTRRESPILDLSLLRERYFAVANAAAFLFSVGFFAYLFVNVQFLTGVWRYSVLGAGLAMTPGPLFAAAASGPAGRLADRYGHRVVIAPGAALFAAGVAYLATRMGDSPDYWREMFPASVLGGLGVGFTISTIGSAATAFLPPQRFAMGSAFNNTCRQVGAAMGIALAVAMLGQAARVGALTAFHRTWTVLGALALVSGALMGGLYRRPAYAPEPDVIAEGATVAAPAVAG
ncbi:MAG TPA: MFS transporter [Acidimicrobiales bacterium]|nr:MFS transporter [Acidimicrobiales bacterium]